jgi:hypothetical protein
MRDQGSSFLTKVYYVLSAARLLPSSGGQAPFFLPLTCGRVSLLIDPSVEPPRLGGGFALSIQ